VHLGFGIKTRVGYIPPKSCSFVVNKVQFIRIFYSFKLLCLAVIFTYLMVSSSEKLYSRGELPNC